MLQMSINDYLTESIRADIEPKLKIGDRIYKVVLDVIETGIIDRHWDCGEEYGYSTDRAGNDPITCWDRDIGNTIFIDKNKVHEVAKGLRNTYKVIRAKNMEVIKERNFISPCKDERILISATVKLLKGNMIYFNKWYTYHFLKVAENEKDAEKIYKQKLDEIKIDTNITESYEVNLPAELKDMYLCKNGKWSEYRYAHHNGAVIN